MPILPKSLITLGTGLLTARTARRLRRTDQSLNEQARALAHLTTRFATT